MWCITQTSNETFAGLAQSVEQLTCNQQVEGSIPLAGFKKQSTSQDVLCF